MSCLWLGGFSSKGALDWVSAAAGMFTAIDRLWSYGNQTWPIKWNAVSSRLRLCRYCYMDALLGCWLNGWRRSSTAIIQECCEQYWTSPGSNTPQGDNYTVTYHLSWKLYKLDEPDMPDTAGEARTRL